MAKYSKRAGEKVAEVMREKKQGTLRSGGSGKKVTSRKQAIAIGLSEARREGAKVPKKKTAKKSTGAKKRAGKAPSGTSPKKTTGRKTNSPKKSGAKKKSAGRRAKR